MIGLPWMKDRTALLAPWAASSVLFLVYVMTMCRDLYWYDSAELAIAAVQPGLSHPPGQPLHTLVGMLLARIVPGRPLVGLNLLSALCAALTLVPALRISRALDPGAGDRPAWIGAAVLFGLGLLNPIWDSAARIEVYSLAGLVAACQIAHMLHAIVPLNTSKSLDNKGSFWLVQGWLLGLAFSVHPYVALFLCLGAVLALAGPLTRRRPNRPALCAGMLLAGGALGLAPYAYVPASALLGSGHLVWGDPKSLANLLHYFGGADYSANRAPLLVAAWQSIHFIGWMARSPLLLPAVVAGAAAWWQGRNDRGSPGTGARLVPLALIVPGLAVIGRIGNYRPEIPDFMGYLVPAFWISGAGLAAFMERTVRMAVRRERRAAAAGAVVLWVAACAFLPPSLHSRSRDRNDVARTIAAGVLMDAPEDAIVLAGSDHVVFPVLYLTEVEGVRPDVVVLPSGWGSSSWYWKHLHERHPDLVRIDLGAPDRWTRIERFLAANPDRPVVAESARLAALAQGPIVRSGWTLRAGAGSAGVDREIEGGRHVFARARLHALLARFGSPGTLDRPILSFIATGWARDDLAGGLPGQAVLDHLAGSPTVDIALPASLMEPAAWRAEIPPPPRPPRYELLSSPEYNLFSAAVILSHHLSGGRAAEELAAAAAALGSDQALSWLAARRAPAPP